jgi:N-acetylmuramoyl-L-alanine amidase
MLFLLASTHAQFSGRKFVIDAGHGGTDPARSASTGEITQTRRISYSTSHFALRPASKAPGAEVILTRSTDAFVSLTARRDLTNAEDPDAFLSIHCNSFGDSSAHGTEAFWWDSGNSADQALATAVQNRMLTAFGLTNRGVKQANFTVITSSPPASLAEMMFISNQAEYDLMNTPATRQAAAEAFYQAFGDFLGIDTSAPVVTDHPDNITVNASQTAQFIVAASGSGLTYRWRKDGVNLSNGGGISGATTTTLTVANAQLASTGFYTCAITGGASSTTVVSNEGQLVVTSSPIAAGSGAGVRGTYYDNPDFTALRRARVDAAINFQWGAGSPSSTMQADTFSARWTGQLQPRLTQSYRFHTHTDDGVRLWINGALVIDKWIDQGAVEWSSAPIPLTAGQKYDFVMEYYENAGDALAELRWSAPSLLKEIIPTTQLYRPPPVLATIPATQSCKAINSPSQSCRRVSILSSLRNPGPISKRKSTARPTSSSSANRSSPAAPAPSPMPPRRARPPWSPRSPPAIPALARFM